MVAGLFTGRLASHLNVFSWTALALLLMTVACAVFVLMPQAGLASENLRSSMDWYHAHGAQPGAAEVYRVSTAENLIADVDDNRLTVRRVTRVFVIECILLGAQLLLWMLRAAPN